MYVSTKSWAGYRETFEIPKVSDPSREARTTKVKHSKPNIEKTYEKLLPGENIKLICTFHTAFIQQTEKFLFLTENMQ